MELQIHNYLSVLSSCELTPFFGNFLIYTLFFFTGLTQICLMPVYIWNSKNEIGLINLSFQSIQDFVVKSVNNLLHLCFMQESLARSKA